MNVVWASRQVCHWEIVKSVLRLNEPERVFQSRGDVTIFVEYGIGLLQYAPYAHCDLVYVLVNPVLDIYGCTWIRLLDIFWL
eukprot:COSAG02_NODE_7207_length_3119_cov_96.839404_3_plen_82_part_00